jgi:predicted RNA-binding protein
MCQAKVYLDGNQVAEEVIWLEPVEHGFLLRTLFDEPQKVQGRLESIDLLKHRVLLVSMEKNQPAEMQAEGGQARTT